ncbi:N-terminal C2 in EEIG1 and EHBP1 proteins-domain-containing protein [Mycena maculata]|uniref:N-terminal C2 in EEIG1 and EHBP1 proteins-domain-containing protein n=1 Tax=Mycena maculata TaxID=230809 RepID=A0AAD7H6V7_9AGAR|nr:N-terminal C2 in EEIG1 and EHBP1 proteins-domain-containing protein [Mycena maculata]
MTNHNIGDPAPAPPTGLRAQLHHLLPRHALFRVHITIHQLASVPLVAGEFGVRWKFAHWKKKATHEIELKGKGKAKVEAERDGDDDSFGSDSAEEAQSPSRNHSVSSSLLGSDEVQARTAARGQTPWLPLRDHAVSWDQPLSAVVQMSIDRDTHRLLPQSFKLTVLQRVIANDPDAPHNPRLGVVEIDLAEYADSVPASSASKGIVTRRYLLRDSKTNATLRLSIRVEPIGTPPQFIAPPLPNGEILAGVATLLSTHADVYRTRPRALDLYAPVESNVLLSSRNSSSSKDSNKTQLFDVHALPRAYGPRPTESLIDALFNPAPVREERLVSPFTKLVTGEPGSVTSFPSFANTSLSTSTSTSSRSSRSATPNVSAESASLYSSMAPSSTGHGSLTPSSRGHSHAPSVSSSTHGSTNMETESHSRHWWKRNRDRSRSRTRGSVAVA